MKLSFWTCVVIVGLIFTASAARAKDAAAPAYTFSRGLIVNHWLADNLPASMMKDAHYGADWFDAEDVGWIADQGFDHLRIWVSGHEWVDASGRLVDSKIAPFETALRNARGRGLGVVLAMHSLPRYRATVRGEPEPANAGSPFADALVRKEAENLWHAVAKRFSAYDSQLRFELINQPEAANAEQMREFNRIMLSAIRRSDQQRVVYLSGRDSDVEFIDDVMSSDPRTAVALSFREPGVFAFQYRAAIPKISFPGTVPDLGKILPADHPWQAFSNVELTVDKLTAQIRAMAAKVKRAAGKREVYVHNIGVITFRTDADSVRTYMRTVRTGLEQEGFSWAAYDYHTGCAVRAAAGTGGPTAVLEGLGLSRAN